MSVSSRTPEGQPARCPLCNATVVIEPSVLIGDATCPQCGQLLWFLRLPEHVRIFHGKQSWQTRDRIVDRVSQQLGVQADAISSNPNVLRDLGADSLDMVELMLELEAEFDLDSQDYQGDG